MNILGFLKKWPEGSKTCLCGCVFNYENTDVEHKTHSWCNYFGAGWETTYFVKCPNCGREVFIRKEEGGR